MKHILKVLILASLFAVTGISTTHAIQLENKSSKETSCPGAIVDEIFYISDDKVSYYTADSYRSSNRRAISNYESKVSIWQSDTSLLSGCTTADSWKMASNVSPGNNEWVIAFGANCTYNKPTNKNKRTLQIVYNVGNYTIGNSGGINLGNYTFTYHRNVSEIRNETPNYLTVNNAHLNNLNVHSNECFNVELRYCGDGLITDGETCDPEHPDYNESTCSKSTCTPISTPTPKITVDKTDANPADLDANEDDSQTVNKGDASVFKITVTNTGEEDLKNVVLTDAQEASCNRTVSETNTLISQIGNKDTIFNVGEVFSYTCQKDNTQSNYVNIIKVSGVGVTSGKNVDDEDPTNILVLPIPQNYDLALRKTLSSTTPGPFAVGDTVTFDVQVINQGNVDANNIEVTDYIPTGLTLADSAWTQSGSTATRVIASLTKGNSVTLPITFTINSSATGSITNYAEISKDDGDDCDSTPDSDNTNDGTPVNDEVGSGCNPGGDEDDHDPETIEIGKFDLALKKVLSSTTPGPFAVGDTVTFDIVVTNQGGVDAANVEITDYIPTGLTLADSAWTQSGATATRVIASLVEGNSVTLPITFTINSSATTSITNYAEISEDNADDCDSTADNDNTNDGTPTDNDIGDGCNPGGDEDDHDPETITLGQVYDLALVKKVSPTTSGPFSIGDTVTFDIVVTNQGTIDANNIEITDYIPTGLTLADSAWTQSGSTAVRTVSSITAGNSVTLPITFTINSSATGSITNYAEISKDDGDDCDSTPDSDNTNDGTPINDDIGDGCNPGGDEDDHDPETITLENMCTNLTASPSTGTNSLTSTVVCTGKDVTTFKIDCGNGATFTGAGTNNGTETFTKTCNYTSVGSYTPKCFINDTITSNSCQKTVTVNPSSSSSSSSSSGGIPAACNSISRSGDSITCNGNSQTKFFRVECGNGTPLQVKQAVFVPNTGRTEAVFDCDYSTTGNEKTSTAVCSVTKNNSASSTSWSTRKACELGDTPTICGDGVIQRPNSNGQNEQCEKIINTDGSIGSFPSNCTSTCQFSGGGGGGSSSSSSSSGGGSTPNPGNVITIPNHGDIVFGPVGTTIIGHGKNPLVENGEYPFIRNDSDYDLYFDELCITRSDGTSLTGNTTQCTALNDILYPGEKVELNPYPLYTGNKNAVPVGQSYGSNVLTTTIKTDGVLYDTAYFAADLNVRVSKPSIATTGGGTSFIKDSSKIADVNNVAIKNVDENKNFVGTSVSTGSLSSYTSTVNDTASVTEIEDTTDISESSVDKIEDATATIATITSLTNSEIKSYHGLANVYILNGSNLTISSIPSGLTGPRTYIIQDANLIINGNLNYSDNIAFVVKGGNIQVDASVTKLSGTYISIPGTSGGGKIEGIGGNTDNILTVQGSLYGNLTNLIDKRTYISNDTNTGQINVGTIVSFGSQVFKKPAPLVGKFISEYLASNKVAQ